MKPSFLRKTSKIKSILSSSFLNGSEKETLDNFAIVHPIEKN